MYKYILLGKIHTALIDFAPAIAPWSAAAGVESEDVRQEIVVAVLAGEDPAREVPKALGIRKVGGVWRSVDACIAAAHDEYMLEDAAACEKEECVDDDSGIAMALVGGTASVAVRCGIGRRAAQMRVAVQAQRFAEAGDLFCGGGR